MTRKCLHVIEVIQKEGKWAPNELTERRMINRRAIIKIFLF